MPFKAQLGRLIVVLTILSVAFLVSDLVTYTWATHTYDTSSIFASAENWWDALRNPMDYYPGVVEYIALHVMSFVFTAFVSGMVFAVLTGIYRAVRWILFGNEEKLVDDDANANTTTD